MREFDKPIGRAWRRMRMQRFLSALIWCWAFGLAVVAGLIAFEKFSTRTIPGPDWLPFAIAGGAGLFVAALIALFTGPSRVDAAIAIDRRFDLNDRLATTLTLPEELRETSAGRALIADTVKHVSDLAIGEKFGLAMPKRAWIPLIPAAVAVGLMFVSYLPKTQAGTSNKPLATLDKEVTAKQLKTIAKSFAEKKKDAEAQNLSAETQKIIAEIQEAAEKLAKSPPSEKDKVLVEMNKLQDAVKERQKQVGTAEQIAKQLQQMKDMSNNGPADEFAKDMAKGDFEKAANELKNIAEKLKSGQMTEKEKKALADQLSEMKQQMQKLANMEQRKKQLEEAMKSGAISKEQYEQQVEKLAQQAKDLKKMAQMAEQMQKAADAMAKGDTQKAAEALEMSQQQLAELAKQAQELESLDSAMADLQEAKNGMANDGMNQIGDRMDGMNALGQGGNRPGDGTNGMGRGRGQGDRPEAEDKTASYDSKVKGVMGKGVAKVEGFAKPGKQLKGDSLLEIQGNVEASAVEQAEALSNQKIPKTVKKHAISYFDMIRKGQ